MNHEKDCLLIVGKIVFNDIESGFWSINDGIKNYRINNIPDELKVKDLKVAALIKESIEEMSVFMSGISVKLIDYKIIK